MIASFEARLDAIVTALERVEQRQHSHDLIAQSVLNTLETISGGITRVAGLLGGEPADPATVPALDAVTAALQEHTAALRNLPEQIAAAVRDALRAEEWEVADFEERPE